MIFETHAHYDDEAFNTDRESLLTELKNNNIGFIVNVSSSFPSIESTINLCNQYDFIYGALGIHPSDCGDMTSEHFNQIKSLLNNKKILAVGEIGLDYHYDTPLPDKQKECFITQLNLAKEAKLPVIIHSRDAAKDTYDIMISENAQDIGGVIHCYSYSVEMARDYLNMGFYIGVGGVVTFKNAQKLKDVVKYTPLDRIVTETDSPYLAPMPHRGERNSSLNIKYIIEAIANIKALDVSFVEKTLYKNAINLYRMEGIINA